MQTRAKFEIAAVMAALALLVTVACAPKSPEERVASLRPYYKARLVSFMVKAEPVPEAPAELMDAEEGVAEGAEEVADESVTDEEMPAEQEDVAIRQDVALEILLQHDSPEKLSGITLDVEMVDSDRNPKNSWKVWVDTSKLPKATGTQFTHLLEEVDYVEGDGFNVEVRSPIPPEERSEYREFSEASSG